MKRKLCERRGPVLELPDEAGLVEGEGAAVGRDFEGRGARWEPTREP
ncbi:hypothetical protein AB0M97_25400 [Streptomyces sp. NPDC051207]